MKILKLQMEPKPAPHNFVQKCLILTTILFLAVLVVNYFLGPAFSSERVISFKSSLPQCHCTRTILAPKFDQVQSRDSVCDLYSASRGGGQKVASYSFFGNSQNDSRVGSHYLDQIEARSREISDFYGPDWLMRIYYNLEDGDDNAAEKLCRNWCQNPNIDLCNVQRLNLLGNLKDLQPIGK